MPCWADHNAVVYRHVGKGEGREMPKKEAEEAHHVRCMGQDEVGREDPVLMIRYATCANCL